MDWQPIETAPRNTPILTYSADAASAQHGGIYGFASPIQVLVNWYDDDFDICDEHGDFVTGACYTPTHWMPLPEPPK